MDKQNGILYVVATPIGNLADLSFRALETLKMVDWIAAEDTRHANHLLKHYGVSNKLLSLHQHNEDHVTQTILGKLQNGLSIALVSDAGTPLLSDPGLLLVRAAKNAGFTVVPIPGPCALITALSAAGISMTRFTFEGFPPRTSSARQRFFRERANLNITWIFYEASHRILESLQDLAATLPDEREIVIARELTKRHETIVKLPISEAVAMISHDPMMQKGEFVLIVTGATIPDRLPELTEAQLNVLKPLLRACTLKTAVALAAEITGVSKKILYQTALNLQQ